MQEFLCYAYLPPCSTPRQPCRSLCVAAKTGCETVMNKFGFMWPELLQCDQFPDETCLGQQEASTTPIVKESGTVAFKTQLSHKYSFLILITRNNWILKLGFSIVYSVRSQVIISN